MKLRLLIPALCALPAAAVAEPGALMPAWMLAAIGEDPYATIAEAAFPLPPTEAQLNALSPMQRLKLETDVKSVLLRRQLQRKADAGRITEANNFAAAGYARSLGCPQAFTDLLQIMGNGNLNGRRDYAANQALEHWAELLGIDVPSMSVMAQYADLPQDQYEEIIAWLPMPVLFRMLPPGTPLKPYTEQENAELTAILTEMAKRYESVTDAATAEAMAPQVLPVISYLQQAGLLAGRDPASVTPQLKEAAQAYQKQRVRLIHEHFYGSLRLRAIDFFIF